MDDSKREFLEKLFLENYSRMEYYAAKFFKNQDLAQDVVQETFLIAQIKLDQLMASPSPGGWLFQTLKNVIGNTYKQQKRLKEIAGMENREIPVTMEPSVETVYQGTISQEDLRLLIWVYCEEISYADAASRLGISLSACKKRIQRARRKFKAALEKDDTCHEAEGG